MYESGASDGLNDVLVTLVTLLLCGYGVMLLYRVLRRGRPELTDRPADRWWRSVFA